jgi:hypothetical protein
MPAQSWELWTALWGSQTWKIMVGAGHQQVGMILDPGQALYSRAYHFVSIRYDVRYIVTLLPVIRGKEGNRDNFATQQPRRHLPDVNDILHAARQTQHGVTRQLVKWLNLLWRC